MGVLIRLSCLALLQTEDTAQVCCMYVEAPPQQSCRNCNHDCTVSNNLIASGPAGDWSHISVKRKALGGLCHSSLLWLVHPSQGVGDWERADGRGLLDRTLTVSFIDTLQTLPKLPNGKPSHRLLFTENGIIKTCISGLPSGTAV
jgi:hypothetical protein